MGEIRQPNSDLSADFSADAIDSTLANTETLLDEKRRTHPPRVKGDRILRYRIARIMEKRHCTEEEAAVIVQSQNKTKFTSTIQPKRSAWAQKKKPITYITDGQVVTSIVSGGGGPGSGKRK
jgi:hypothetical protein